MTDADRRWKDGWDHNAHYHRFLVSAVPHPCRRALDVGCGSGAFARRLASVADHVDALDRDATLLLRARELGSGIGHLSWIEADFLEWPGDGDYDFVSFVASIHHLPFAVAMSKATGLLRPGGVLAVLGLDRAASWFHRGMRNVVAYPVSRYFRLTRPRAAGGASLIDPSMTLDEFRRQA